MTFLARRRAFGKYNVASSRAGVGRTLLSAVLDLDFVEIRFAPRKIGMDAKDRVKSRSADRSVRPTRAEAVGRKVRNVVLGIGAGDHARHDVRCDGREQDSVPKVSCRNEIA